MKKEAKSQAALEFLTTYAWAFLVIMLTIGALYYFGIFDFQKFLPQKCIFPSQFECIDFSLTGDDDPDVGGVDDVIKLRLVNNLGEEININEMTITNDAVESLECTNPPAITNPWRAGDEKDFTFSQCSKGVFIVGERTDAIITIEYCAPATANCEVSCDTSGCPKHTVKGKIIAVVSSP